MRFHFTEDTGSDVQFAGTAHNLRDGARVFCNFYRLVSEKCFQSGSFGLIPVFWDARNGQRASRRRVIFVYDEQPFFVTEVCGCQGRDTEETDGVVLMPEEMLSDPRLVREGWRMMQLMLADAASFLAVSSVIDTGLGWTAHFVVRAAISAVGTRAFEHLIPEEPRDGVYTEICAAAVTDMVEARYSRTNGEAIFVEENPGVVTLVDRVVRMARAAAPLPLPMDADDMADQASRNISICLEGLMKHLRPLH